MALPKRIDWRVHALFLDFDGTLAPIVSRPEDVVVSARTHEVLARLQRLTGGALAVLSGRALVDLETRLAPTSCAMSGSHGLEIRHADGHDQTLLDATGFLTEARDEVLAFADQNGLIAEDKPGAMTLHYRSNPDLATASRSLVDRLAQSGDALRALHGNMVSEITLTGVDKGAALAKFMEDAPFKGRVPVMAGDDVTDEDAFMAAQHRHGFGIKIGSGPTIATHRAIDIDAFLEWLCRRADLPPLSE